MAYFLKVTLYCMCVSVVPPCVPCLYSAHAVKKAALEPLEPLLGTGNGAQALCRAVSAFIHEPAPSPSLVVLILFVYFSFLKLF